jgi:hypothetical protein
MADACNENEETNVYFEALDASKIPGATLAKRPEQMTVQELRRWLSCRNRNLMRGKQIGFQHVDMVE